MSQHKNNNKKLSSKGSQNREAERKLPQKIKDLVQAPPHMIESMPEGPIKKEVKELREFAREEGVEV